MKTIEKLLVILIAVLQGCLVTGQSNQCFVQGECLNSNLLEIVGAADQFKCLELCQSDRRCTWFTFDQESGGCRLLSNCLFLDETSCPQCMSGEVSCSVPVPICWFQGKCLGNVVQVDENIPMVQDCLWTCKRLEGCMWFTYYAGTSSCALMSDCPYIDVSCDTCFSGISECGFIPKRLTKLLVGVGAITGGILSQEFEVIDLDNTKTHCQSLPNFPKTANNAFGGLVFQDQPLICGGSGDGSVSKECHIFKNGAWNQFHDLNEPRTYMASVTLNSTIFVLGGGNNIADLNSAEIATMHGWETVLPNVPVSQIYFHCLVRLNSTTVIVIGGEQDRQMNSPKTYYFNTHTKVWSDGPELNHGRIGHSCAQLRKDDQSDQFSVIVAGGVTGDHVKPVEILDDGASEWRLGPNLPLDISGAPLVQDPSGGVLFIGGSATGYLYLDTIYSLAHAGPDAEWSLLPQKLKTPRREHQAFLVPDDITECSEIM